MKITLESIDVYVLYFWIGQFWKKPIPHFLHSFSPEVDASMSPPTDPGSAASALCRRICLNLLT